MVELKVRRQNYPVELPVLGSETIVERDQLCAVVAVYHKSNYLKSFGYQKLKLSDARQNERPHSPEPANNNDDEEFYYDDK